MSDARPETRDEAHWAARRPAQPDAAQQTAGGAWRDEDGTQPAASVTWLRFRLP